MAKPVARKKRSGVGTKRASTRNTKSARPKRSSGATAKPRTPSKAKTATATSSKPEQLSADLDEILPEGKLYYRIGEVSDITGVKAYVLRYWESEFRWMSPQKSRSKQRLYRRKDIETILLIRNLLYEERYTIAGARLRLRELSSGKAALSRAKKPPSAVAGRVAEAELAVGADGDHRGWFREIKQELIEIRSSL